MSSNYSVLNQDLDNILELRSNWYFPSQGDTQWFGFGQNNFNIFGSENSPNVYTPSPVTRLINFTKISTGCFHTAGIDANGHLWMWGNNDCGQLGLGDTTNRIAPTQLGTDTWIEVAAGAQHTLAIKSDTSLWVWGRNQDFELGTGTSDWGNHPNSLVPIQPSFYGTSATGWKKVFCGGLGAAKSFAIQSAGTEDILYGWGYNYWGDSGVNSSGNWIYAPTRVLNSMSNPHWTQVSMGNQFEAGIRANYLYTWGWNNAGYDQQGRNLGYDSATMEPTLVTPNPEWKMVSCGPTFALAIKLDGTLWGWGSNEAGQLGDGTLTTKHIPVRIGSANDWSIVGTGYWSTAAIKTDGTLWTWGAADALGNGYPAMQTLTPIQVGTDTNYIGLSASGNNSFLVKKQF